MQPAGDSHRMPHILWRKVSTMSLEFVSTMSLECFVNYVLDWFTISESSVKEGGHSLVDGQEEIGELRVAHAVGLDIENDDKLLISGRELALGAARAFPACQIAVGSAGGKGLGI